MECVLVIRVNHWKRPSGKTKNVLSCGQRHILIVSIMKLTSCGGPLFSSNKHCSCCNIIHCWWWICETVFSSASHAVMSIIKYKFGLCDRMMKAPHVLRSSQLQAKPSSEVAKPRWKLIILYRQTNQLFFENVPPVEASSTFHKLLFL